MHSCNTQNENIDKSNIDLRWKLEWLFLNIKKLEILELRQEYYKDIYKSEKILTHASIYII